MVVSCYADTSVAEGFETHWRQHLKAEATRVRELLAGDPEALREFKRQLETLWQALESPEARHARGMAVFAASGWDQAMALSFNEPYEDRLVVDEEPYLVPLLVANYRRREYLVVLTNTHRGRLYASSPGVARLLDELDVAVPKGEPQAKIERRRKDHILHYQKELMRRVEKAWAAHPYQGIILLGEHQVLENFRGLLPKPLADRVVHEAPHAWHGRLPEIRDRVREVVAAAIEGQQERLLEEIDRRLGEGFAVATGPQEVIEALGNGQVLELVFWPDRGEFASRCKGCRSVFATNEEACPYCKDPCARVNLWQEILSMAARHGIAIHFVTPDARRSPFTGVVALLARDEPQWSPVPSADREAIGNGNRVGLSGR